MNALESSDVNFNVWIEVELWPFYSTGAGSAYIKFKVWTCPASETFPRLFCVDNRWVRQNRNSLDIDKGKTKLPDTWYEAAETAVGVGTMVDPSVALACSTVPKELVTMMGPTQVHDKWTVTKAFILFGITNSIFMFWFSVTLGLVSCYPNYGNRPFHSCLFFSCVSKRVYLRNQSYQN